ncbi:MAG: peptide chain release factor N(5)-glutamine methyltransferase [Anaerolineae bacterium]|nr:peptide chain release factor N(5)-glutamine methyltransferase [Anaerolineae bacterium]
MTAKQSATIQDALLAAVRALGATMPYYDARLQAELLLAHALETTRENVLARLDEPIAPDVAARYAANVARRAKHEPLAYILGRQKFYGLDFVVDRRVMIPRHETELLVQLALERARRQASPVIVDVGTGSGVLAITLAHHLSRARVMAIDISRDALEVARLNAQRLGVDARIEFIESDLLECLTVPFDVLVANLPYIPRARFDELPREIRAFEPRLALDGGEDGLAVFRRLIAQLPTHAARGAIALLEISEEQGSAALEAVYRVLPQTLAVVHRDLELLDRVVEIRWDIES